MTIVVPTPVPDASLPLPDPSDLATWGARMAEMHRWMRENLRPGSNALADAAYENALDAQGSAGLARGHANFVGAWSAQTGPATVPYGVAHSGRLWVLLNNLADVTTSEPGVAADWIDATGVLRTGDTMSGPLVVPAGATGLQAVPANETVRLLGGAANLPTWTTAGRPASPSDGFFGKNTDLKCIEFWDASFSSWIQTGWQSSAPVTASGTAVDFTGIPAWANEVKIKNVGLSTNGTATWLYQAGSSAGMVTSGYGGAGSSISNTVGTANFTAGLGINQGNAINSLNGEVVFSRVSGNQWLISANLSSDANNATFISNAVVTLPGALDRVRWTTTGGTNTADAGQLALFWRA